MADFAIVGSAEVLGVGAQFLTVGYRITLGGNKILDVPPDASILTTRGFVPAARLLDEKNTQVITQKIATSSATFSRLNVNETINIPTIQLELYLVLSVAEIINTQVINQVADPISQQSASLPVVYSCVFLTDPCGIKYTLPFEVVEE